MRHSLENPAQVFQGNGKGAYFFILLFLSIFLIAKQAHPSWTLYSKGWVIAKPFSDQRAPAMVQRLRVCPGVIE